MLYTTASCDHTPATPIAMKYKVIKLPEAHQYLPTIYTHTNNQQALKSGHLSNELDTLVQ